MISWVLVSERMKRKTGCSSWGVLLGGGSALSSLSFFLRRSRRGILVMFSFDFLLRLNYEIESEIVWGKRKGVVR
jgi:hypothetical protein